VFWEGRGLRFRAGVSSGFREFRQPGYKAGPSISGFLKRFLCL